MEFTTQEIENLVREPIRSFTVGKGCNADDKNCSELLKITVESASGKTIHLVYKKFSDEESIKEFVVRDQLFLRENIFYKEFAPNVASLVKSHLEKIYNQQDSSKLEETSTQLQLLPIPKYFAGFNDDENDFICVEDLRPQKFRMADKTIGLNLNETLLVLQNLAQFHAISYFYLKFLRTATDEKDGNVFGVDFEQMDSYKVYQKRFWAAPMEIDCDAGAGLKSELEGFLLNAYKNGVKLMESHCTASDKEALVSKMTGENDSVINSAYATITSTTLNTDSKYFPLLIHGDVWVNNLLFSYNEDNQPVDLKFIDFQYARRGNIYEELNYFFSTSTTTEFRKARLETCLNTYYAKFISTLELLNSPPPLNFTKDQFFQDFRENVLPSYLMLSMLIPLQLGKGSEDGSVDADTGIEFTEKLTKRMERSPLACRRWEEATREVIDLRIL